MTNSGESRPEEEIEFIAGNDGVALPWYPIRESLRTETLPLTPDESEEASADLGIGVDYSPGVGVNPIGRIRYVALGRNMFEIIGSSENDWGDGSNIVPLESEAVDDDNKEQ